MFDKLFNDHFLFAMQKNKNIQLHWDPRGFRATAPDSAPKNPDRAYQWQTEKSLLALETGPRVRKLQTQ